MHATRTIPILIAAAALLSTQTTAAGAQISTATHVTESSCLSSIPDSALWRVAVYLQAELIDSANAANVALLPQLDLVTQELADRVRALLGGTLDTLPMGEPTVTWPKLRSKLRVVVRRGGQVASMEPIPDTSLAVDGLAPDTAAAHLLMRSLAAVVEEEKYLLFWPDETGPDSVAFHLAFHYPLVDAAGVSTPPTVRQAFAIFSLAVPTQEPVTVKHQSNPKYPENFPEKGITGDLVMQFIVDTTGRAEMATVEDLWPSSRPRLTGEMGRYYDAFRRAVVRSISRDRFEPARIGGCRVRQLVQMPFGFRVGP
jgi:hypothetical protein